MGRTLSPSAIRLVADQTGTWGKRCQARGWLILVALGWSILAKGGYLGSRRCGLVPNVVQAASRQPLGLYHPGFSNASSLKGLIQCVMSRHTLVDPDLAVLKSLIKLVNQVNVTIAFSVGVGPFVERPEPAVEALDGFGSVLGS